ncbi:MAG TPA: S1C family serine protease, partial [Patescibacteria group bacterium]|nr:S1C family serine protease [Patescibacteria group bacterium]
NKTEQIIIREDDSVEKIVSQPATAVVNIVALATQDVSSQKERATITGVLLTNDGLVVTYSEKPFGNGDIRYSIVLFDGTSHAADFVGYDTLSNLSFFRLRDTTNTPAIALANSDDARVGKKLIAMGNAFAEYQNRLSVGILGNNNQVFNLSGKTVSSSEKWEGVFEMNVDNTEDFIGGPVIGFNGEMVGLMGAIVMDNTLQTFLIPSNVIRESLGRAVSKTLDKRPVLGIYYLPITKTLALGQGLSRDHGALIYSPSGRTGLALIAGSPAMRAGLQVGDIIIAINGSEITLDTPLPKILTRFNRGDTIEMLIVRNEAERTLSIAL